MRVEDDDVIVDLSRAALIVPNVIIEGAAALLLPERVRSNGYVLLDRGGGSEDLVGLFVRHLLKRERSFFAKIGESPLVTADVEDGSGEIDSHDFDEHQVRVMLDSLKKAARERFGIASLDLDSAVKLASSGSWADVLLVPAAVAAYGARFGIDRTWTFSEEVRIQFHLERGSRIYRTLGQDSHHNIGSLAVNLFGLPVGVLLSLDARAGRLETGFIGIGTSLSAMLEAIAGCEEGPR